MTLEELRDALKAAEGPDHGLDREISNLVIKRGGQTALWDVPFFTMYVDVALRLVPDNHGWGLEGPGGWTVWWQWPDGKEVARAIGKTPALALCIARVEYEIARDHPLREVGA